MTGSPLECDRNAARGVVVGALLVAATFFGLYGTAPTAVYRAYRVPYGWIPQLTVPKEQRVTPPALGEFRVP